jgi:diguanylate cyclase (GGDEF)-like protein
LEIGLETSEREAYRGWLEEVGATSIWFYAGFIVVLLPAFHFILSAVPGHPPDSLPIRIAAAAISAGVGLTVWLYRPARRFAVAMQILNVLPTMLAIDVLVVDSGNHYLYIASALLMIVGAQQAFYRAWPLALCMIVALAFQALYSAFAGIFYTPANIATLAIFAAGYVLAFIPAALRMRIERREILGRLEARKLARNDALTGLPNRASLGAHLAETLKGASGELGCAVLFLDLDGFKDVNDSLGHGVGDVLLRSVAQRLESALDSGTILARWGGDEFVIVLPAVGDPSAVSAFAAKICSLFTQPFFVDGYELAITASLGISLSPADGTDANVLIRNADTAMYRAKESYAPRVAFWAPEMHDAADVRYKAASALREAVLAERFILHYQPIVDTASARLVGAEALLRWPDPSGMRYPATFIGVAEESGLIVPLGAWVLRSACAQLALWNRRGLNRYLSVNISARQFMHPDFCATLAEALESSGADPNLLDIEITESTLLSNVHSVRRILEEVKAMGPTVTIDDFGTGYSALVYLKQFSLHALKLDRTFVSDIEHRTERAIARSIVRIAHTLGMKVTAEGVETPEQFDTLYQLRCDRAQGFHLGRPVALEEFDRLYANAADTALVAPHPARRLIALESPLIE